jgi:hypothetical protein
MICDIEINPDVFNCLERTATPTDVLKDADPEVIDSHK